MFFSRRGCLALFVVMMGCADSTSPNLGTLVVSRSSDMLFVGDTAQLASAVSIAGGSASTRLDWTSTNTKSASVSSDGVVTGLAPGSTNILVQIHGSSDSAARATIGLYVSDQPFAMLPDSLRAFVGTYTLLRSGPAPSGVDVTKVQPVWAVSDQSVVSVGGVLRIGAVGYNDYTTTYATVEKAGTATVSLHYSHHTASMKIVAQTWLFSGVTSGGRAPAIALPTDTFTCGLLPTAEAACWGGNTLGQLGTPTWEECQGSGCQYAKAWQGSAAPLFVAGGLTFQTLATGGGFACGITQTGPTYCWGINSAGQLGFSGPTEMCQPFAGAFGYTFVNCSTKPLLVTALVGLTSLSAGGQHVCGLTSTGAAYCWGSNARGQLGSASAGASTSTPTPVDGGLSFRSISAGLKHTCAIAVSGDPYCWGDNSAGQLGISADTTAHFAPVKIANGLTLSTIYAGNTTFGLTSSGGLYRWGPTLEQLAPSTQFATVSVGLTDAGCALDVSGGLSCWGAPNNGVTTVWPFAGGATFKALAATGGLCAQASDNHWYCWSSVSQTAAPTIVPGQP